MVLSHPQINFTAMKNVTIFFLFMLTIPIYGQYKVIVKYDTSGHHYLIKWYYQNIITPQGVHIYQRTNEAWNRITDQPVYPFVCNRTYAPIGFDSSLYNVLANQKEPLSGILKATVLIRSVQSKWFAGTLGMLYQTPSQQADSSIEFLVTSVDSNLTGRGKLEPVAASPPIDTIVENKMYTRVYWTPDSTHFAYHILRQDSGDWHPVTETPILTGKDSVMWWSDSVGSPGIFQYKIIAEDFFGDPLRDGPAFEIRIDKPKLDIQPALAPLSKNRRGVLLNWEESDTILQTFQLVRRKGPAVEELLYEGPDHHFVDTVTIAGLYTYVLRGLTGDGQISKSASAPFQIEDTRAPMRPQKVLASVTDSSIIINWQKCKAKDLLGYMVYRSLDTSTVKMTMVSPQVISDTFLIQRFDRNTATTFFYSVKSVDSTFNQSGYSQMVKASLPDITPPLSPVIKGLALEDNGISIQWFANPEPDVYSYNIYRTDSFGTSLIGKVPFTKLSFTDTMIDIAQRVSYRLTCLDSLNNESEPAVLNDILHPGRTTKPSFEKIKIKKLSKSAGYKLSWYLKPNIAAQFVVLSKSEAGYAPISTVISGQEFSIQHPIDSPEIRIKALLNNGDYLVSEAILLD